VRDLLVWEFMINPKKAFALSQKYASLNLKTTRAEAKFIFELEFEVMTTWEDPNDPFTM
jgi:hypothetical protein